jgi:hypothetical protein
MVKKQDSVPPAPEACATELAEDENDEYEGDGLGTFASD